MRAVAEGQSSARPAPGRPKLGAIPSEDRPTIPAAEGQS